MPSGVRWSACLLSCLVLTACAGNDLIVKRQAEADAKIELLLQAEKKNAQLLSDLSARLQSQDDRYSEMAPQVKNLQGSIQELRTAQEELKTKVSGFNRQAATPKIEVVNPEATQKSKENGPPAEYVAAFGMYSANRFPAAIEAFESFLKNNPGNDYSANAYYWIGECHYSMSDLGKAQTAFQKVVDSYPKSNKVPDAMLKLGYTLAALKENAKAKAVFEGLIKAYPGNPAAAKARERLTAN